MADYSHIQSKGGQKRAAVAAGTTGADSVVSAKPGRLCKLVVTTAGTADIELYDHATATSGADILWRSATQPAVGDNIVLDLPVANGIVALKQNGSAAVTVTYTEDTVSGSGYDKVLPYSEGGQYKSLHAAGATGAAAASAVPGRLCRLVVLSAGSAETIIYDHATAASGTKLYTLKANPTVGDVLDLQIPVSAGIYVAGATNTSQILVTYNKNTSANGR